MGTARRRLGQRKRLAGIVAVAATLCLAAVVFRVAGPFGEGSDVAEEPSLFDTGGETPRLEVFDLPSEMSPPDVIVEATASEDGESITYTVSIENHTFDKWWHPVTIDLSDVLDDADFLANEFGQVFQILTWIDAEYSPEGSPIQSNQGFAAGELSGDGTTFELVPDVPAGAHITVIYTVVLRPDGGGDGVLADAISLVEEGSSLEGMAGVELEVNSEVVIEDDGVVIDDSLLGVPADPADDAAEPVGP